MMTSFFTGSSKTLIVLILFLTILTVTSIVISVIILVSFKPPASLDSLLMSGVSDTGVPQPPRSYKVSEQGDVS